MEELSSIAMLITVVSALLRAFPVLRLPGPLRAAARLPSGAKFLLGFLFVVLAFGCYSAYKYWPQLTKDQDTFMFAAGLLLTMATGMIVQVLASNYRAGRALFDVTAAQLVFPMLFALIVFYPIWALAASAPRGLFPFYAAFLNGYFWESVVSTAKAPTAPAIPPI